MVICKLHMRLRLWKSPHSKEIAHSVVSIITPFSSAGAKNAPPPSLSLTNIRTAAENGPIRPSARDANAIEPGWSGSNLAFPAETAAAAAPDNNANAAAKETSRTTSNVVRNTRPNASSL